MPHVQTSGMAMTVRQLDELENRLIALVEADEEYADEQLEKGCTALANYHHSRAVGVRHALAVVRTSRVIR